MLWWGMYASKFVTDKKRVKTPSQINLRFFHERASTWVTVFNQKSVTVVFVKIKLKLTKAHQSQGRLQMVMLRRSSPITRTFTNGHAKKILANHIFAYTCTVHGVIWRRAYLLLNSQILIANSQLISYCFLLAKFPLCLQRLDICRNHYWFGWRNASTNVLHLFNTITIIKRSCYCQFVSLRRTAWKYFNVKYYHHLIMIAYHLTSEYILTS